MKKPVKPTAAEIDAKVDTLKTRTITVYGNRLNGTWMEVVDKVREFADENGVEPEDVKIGGYWNTMSCKREETRAEKRKRIADDMNRRYHQKKYSWDNIQAREKYEREQAEATLRRLNAQTAQPKSCNITVTCKCKCACNGA